MKMETLQNIQNLDYNKIIDSSYYLNTKHLFYVLNGSLPMSYNIHPVDPEKALKIIQDKYKAEINSIFTSNSMSNVSKKSKYELCYAVVVFKNKSVIKIGYSFCDLYCTEQHVEFILALTEAIKPCKRMERKKEFEINLIAYNGRNFELNPIDIKKTRLNLDLYYEDEFLETDKIIRERLNRNKDKGIVLLHGLPGTGKTTYLRYLIGKVKKRVLFVPPSVAGNITNPEFMNLLLEYPNSILIIEDAENIIMDRQITGSSAVSNLLNISDGLLGDCLNTQIICTFNMPISKIDTALTRKGRLIAKYHFGKLSVAKAQQLSDKMKLGVFVTEPMSLAELFNTHEKDSEDTSFRVLGFKRVQVLN